MVGLYVKPRLYMVGKLALQVQGYLYLYVCIEHPC